MQQSNEAVETYLRWVCPISGCKNPRGSLIEASAAEQVTNDFKTHLQGHSPETVVTYVMDTADWRKSLRVVKEG